MLGTCNDVNASERKKKLMGAEDLETEPTVLLKAWRRKEGREKVVGAGDRAERGGGCFWAEECEKRQRQTWERGRGEKSI